jgi:polysaccharide export outer membrane protein
MIADHPVLTAWPPALTMGAHRSRLSRRIVAVSLILGSLIGLSAGLSANSLAQQQSSPPGFEACPGDYVIGPEDVLDIAVWNNTEITRTVPVRPDGKISLPLLNDVQAAGSTPMQLRKNLTDSLAEYIATPIVSVIVREIHSFKVTVIGEVKTAGRYELKSRATIVDLLAMAGGPTDYAARGKILILRQQGRSIKQIPFALERLTAKSGSVSNAANGSDSNICLMPGDIIVVP